MTVKSSVVVILACSKPCIEWYRVQNPLLIVILMQIRIIFLTIPNQVLFFSERKNLVKEKGGMPQKCLTYTPP